MSTCPKQIAADISFAKSQQVNTKGKTRAWEGLVLSHTYIAMAIGAARMLAAANRLTAHEELKY